MPARSRLALLLVIAIFILVLPNYALASDYIFKGHGWGHGVGMCQYGADGLGKAGKSYEDIIRFYYTGVTIQDWNTNVDIRVGIFLNQAEALISADGSFSFYNLYTGAKITDALPGQVWKIRSHSLGLQLFYPDGTSQGVYTGPIKVVPQNCTLTAQSNRYRGFLEIRKKDSMVNIINIVPLELYLRGISEMPTRFSFAAQQAQAVAARTYALRRMSTETDGYHILASSAHQVYLGVSAEMDIRTRAVTSTQGKVITYGGSLISAVYHSTCGGHTENNENVWGGGDPNKAAPYLRGVKCDYCTHSSHYSWEKTISKQDMEAALGIPDVVGFQVLKTGVSPRIMLLRIFKGDGTFVDMTGSEFRQKLGLRSNWVYSLGGRFPDVPLGYWAFNNIESLASKGIITGYPDGLFRPEAHISRSQIAKLVVSSKALSLNTTFKGYFTDVPQDHWAWQYIETAYEQGLVKGFPDKTFKPEDPATRAGAITILMRDHPSNTPGTPFTDVSPDHWAYPYIMTAKNAGIVRGYSDGTFRPERLVTRAEAAKIVDTMLSR